MTLKKVTFPNLDGQALSGILTLPEDDRPFAWAIFSHCFTCTKEYKAPVFVSRELARRGIATLRFDFTGLGESGGEFAETTLTGNVSDIVSAAEFLTDEYDPPSILIGHSMGGAAALLAAKRLDSIRLVASIATPINPGRIGEALLRARARAMLEGEGELHVAGRAYRLKKNFFVDLDETSLKAVLRTLGKPLLVFQSPVDRLVRAGSGEELFQAASHPKSFISLPGADHLLSDGKDARLVAGVIELWVKRYLPGSG